jgi:ribulose-phosphate 3-epimerase
MLPKNQRAQHLLQQCNAHCELEVDGDIDIQTAPLAVHAGADMLVAGTAIFTDQDGPQAGLLRLLQAIQYVGHAFPHTFQRPSAVSQLQYLMR